MKENVENFNESIKHMLSYLVKALEGENVNQEIRTTIKDFWPDYRENILFTVTSLPGNEERAFNIEVSTGTGMSDSSRFYSNSHKEVLNFLKDPSNLGSIIEKVRNMGMALLIEEERRYDSNDDWQ
ncbi:MAG: hypothetical protein ABRQ37_09820 [Candidatus Eremiobacterota bacterium]